MTVLSVDLAYRRYRDCGTVLLRRQAGAIAVDFPSLELSGTPAPEPLAARLAHIAAEAQVHCILLDGPQAWKDEDNGLVHARRCERALNTPAKTGPPGQVKPANYGPFVEFSIAVFDALERLGWPRLEDPLRPRRRSVESFPTAAWRGLGLLSLPAKSRTHPADLQEALRRLCAVFHLELAREPNHDELQAIVAGLGGLALEAQNGGGFRAEGVPPFRKAGSPREGFILLPQSRFGLFPD
ncbi:DUF429 domain-containing protein [Acidithiobacillus sp.]|uniref:DUF429 domain-containing protein n=1 Tax=Acidithiobacillus sp. TaxID=1872118 RepID=UPI0025C68160|nr:DUF429 domain-containing protein [Acidithiobacillus sp.]